MDVDPPPSPTEWAKKYGKFLPGSHKSGLTPLDYYFPVAQPSSQEARDILRIENIQRDQLYDFTTRELGQLDTLCLRELKEGNLPKVIIPMLRRRQWRNGPVFAREHEYGFVDGIGHWSAFSNDNVWDMMEPILALATRILLSTDLLPWFDALLDGERKEIPQYRRQKQDWNLEGVESFHRRSILYPDQVAIRRDEVFEELTRTYNYTFSFGQQGIDPETGDPDPSMASWHGLSWLNHKEMREHPNAEWRACCWLRYEDVESLFRDDLSSSERLAIQWAAANTITHEIMHVIGFLDRYLIGVDKPEPHFEQEPVAELGFSFEIAVNGGDTTPFIRKPGLPLGYWLHTESPSFPQSVVQGSIEIVLKNPGPSNYEEIYPIQVSFYEDMHQNDFWNVGVRTFGHGFLHYRSLRGSFCRIDYVDRQGKVYKGGMERRLPPRYPYTNLSESFRTKVEELRSMAQLTPEQRSAVDFGQRIVISSNAEAEFWTDARFKHTRVTQLFEQIGLMQTSRGTPEVLEEIVRLLTTAITNHQRMIIALENVELANNAVNNDRRKSLLAWNRGTRIFAAEFSRAGGQQTAARLQKIQFALEQCRMVLFTPVTTSIHDGPDWVEVNMVQRARDFFFHNDTANCRAIIDGLHADNGVSRFAGFAALLLLAALRRNEVEGCEERREQILSLATMLEEQRLGAGPGWGPLLRSWEEFAEQLLHSVPQGA